MFFWREISSFSLSKSIYWSDWTWSLSTEWLNAEDGVFFSCFYLTVFDFTSAFLEVKISSDDCLISAAISILGSACFSTFGEAFSSSDFLSCFFFASHCFFGFCDLDSFLASTSVYTTSSPIGVSGIELVTFALYIIWGLIFAESSLFWFIAVG